MTGMGSANLVYYRESGKDLTPQQAIRAKCADCMGDYTDGRMACTVKGCPLWPYMPYNPDRKLRRQVDVPQEGDTSELSPVESILDEGEED